MKLKIITKIVEILLGMQSGDETPRADMYLPERALAMAIVMLAGAVAATAWYFVKGGIAAVVIAVGALAFGVTQLMCWRNQKIRILDSERFEYTTFLGNTRQYAFKDITGLRKNSDSMTLFVGGDKVHMESMAVISDKLAERINQQLQKLHSETPQ